MHKTYDAIILGGGCIGASILYQLCQAGINNSLLIEKNTIGSGATEYSGGMIKAFHLDTEINRLAAQSMDFFRNLNFYKQTGSLSFIPENKILFAQNEMARLKHYSPEIKILNYQSGLKLFPNIEWRKSQMAVYEPYAGYANPVSTARCLVRSAQVMGANILENTEIKDLAQNMLVTSNNIKIKSKMIIIAAGCGSINLLNKLGVELDLFTKTIQLNHYLSPNPFPNITDYCNYSFASYRENNQVIGGSRAPDADYAWKCLNHRITNLKKDHHKPSTQTQDIYTHSGKAKCGFIPGFNHVYIATGWGGTGYKISPAIGKNVASKVLKKLNKQASGF